MDISGYPQIVSKNSRDDSHTYRQFFACRHTIPADPSGSAIGAADITVYVNGAQYADGEIRRDIAAGVLHPDFPISVSQARQLASALVAAADEIDKSSGTEPA